VTDTMIGLMEVEYETTSGLSIGTMTFDLKFTLNCNRTYCTISWMPWEIQCWTQWMSYRDHQWTEFRLAPCYL